MQEHDKLATCLLPVKVLQRRQGSGDGFRPVLNRLCKRRGGATSHIRIFMFCTFINITETGENHFAYPGMAVDHSRNPQERQARCLPTGVKPIFRFAHHYHGMQPRALVTSPDLSSQMAVCM